MSMRNVRDWAAVSFLLFAICIGSDAVAGDQQPRAADLLLVNGHIYTSNPRQPWVRALAIRGPRVAAVGDEKQLAAFRGPATRVIDLGGRMAMPGIIDSHSHFLEGSLSLDQVNLDDVYTIPEIQKRVSAYAAAHPDRAWLLGRGWVYDAFKPSGLPTKEILDEVVPDRPVVLECYDGHSVWVNSRALALAGIDKNTPDPQHAGIVMGTVVHDPATGEPTGVLKEEAVDLVRRVIPKPSREEKLRALHAGLREANRHGLTSVLNASGSLEEMEFGDKGRHARTTVGVSELPAEAAIEVEGLFEVA